ncbi:MAG: hypothetical protein HRT35_21570 [Algicola sp.]|nr:hypothetical protein [Algicola sp.]
MANTPPRSDYAVFQQIHQIYYGTDDGFAELTPRQEICHDDEHIRGLYDIFQHYKAFYSDLAPKRRGSIHLVSVVGGLYGLNLIPMFEPNEITFYDTNVHAVTFFDIIRRVWIDSPDASTFLDKLTHASYEVDSPQEKIIRDCIAATQNGTLTEDRGQTARSLLSSWRYALDHFDKTRDILSQVPVHTRVEDMQSAGFRDFIAKGENIWLFCSNVIYFSFFELCFNYPENAVVFASYFDKTEILDLGKYTKGPVTAHCRLPMSVSTQDQ